MKESCEKTCGFCTSTGTFGNGSSSVVKGESSSSTHLPTSGADPISVSTEEGHLTTHSPSPGNETKEVCNLTLAKNTTWKGQEGIMEG